MICDTKIPFDRFELVLQISTAKMITANLLSREFEERNASRLDSGSRTCIKIQCTPWTLRRKFSGTFIIVSSNVIISKRGFLC